MQNNHWHEEKSARRTVNSIGAASKLKRRVTDNMKRNVEKNKKKSKNHC